MGQEFVFVALLGLSLGVGKVIERLSFKDMAKILVPTTAALLPIVGFYSWTVGIPFELMLLWLVACIMLGVFSSRMVHA